MELSLELVNTVYLKRFNFDIVKKFKNPIIIGLCILCLRFSNQVDLPSVRKNNRFFLISNDSIVRLLTNELSFALPPIPPNPELVSIIQKYFSTVNYILSLVQNEYPNYRCDQYLNQKLTGLIQVVNEMVSFTKKIQDLDAKKSIKLVDFLISLQNFSLVVLHYIDSLSNTENKEKETASKQLDAYLLKLTNVLSNLKQIA
jgi:hypothetical protein